MRPLLIVALSLAGAVGALIGAMNLRRRYNQWGATDYEASAAMPGDEIIIAPQFQSTRAITIDAPPADVWPWLVQMGEGRGGAYTYDWIENMLGLDMHSADRVHPEWQHLESGERLPMGPKGAYMEVKEIEPERTLLFLHSDGNWTWCFTLAPTEDGGTRFISRNRITLEGAPLAARAAMTIIDPGAFIMERKMLLGIKQRAEQLHSDQARRHVQAIA